MLPLTKRQREILDYLNDFIQQHGYAPSLEEIGRRFGLSSLATVHKHLTNLQDKGFIKRAWNRSRSVELVPSRLGGRAIELPLLGYVAAGAPIEASCTVARSVSASRRQTPHAAMCAVRSGSSAPST
jgi:repressor LexA